MPRRSIANLVYNGDFEYAPAFTAATTTNTRWIDGTAGGSSASQGPYGWRTAINAGTFSAQFDDTVSKNGRYSMKLTTSAGGWTDIVTGYSTMQPTLIPVLPSTSYTVSGWIKTSYLSGDGSTGARIFVNTYTGARAYITTPGATTPIKTTTDWTYYSHTFTTSSDARYATVPVSIRGNDGAATLSMTAWFDDIVLTKTTPDARTTVSSRGPVRDSTGSLALDGNAGYLTLPITPAPTGFNFAMWVETGKRTGASVSMLLSSNSAAFTDGFWFGKGNGRGEFEFVGYNSTNSVNTALRTGQVSDGTWAHVAVTYQPSGVCSIYLNGVLVNTVTATNTISTGTTSIYIGRRSYTATFAGLNANQLVWHNTTTPWTATQVQDLYSKGTVPAGATGVYPLDEGAGSIAYDTSGNANNGTITSGSWSKDTSAKSRKAVNGNMVYNGDFEIAPVVNVPTTTGDRYVDGTAGGLSSAGHGVDIFGWYLWNYTTSYAAMFDTSVKRTGTASMKISTTATASTIGLRISVPSLVQAFKKNNIPVLPNTSYTASGWIKTSVVSGSATTGARFQFVTNTGTSDVTTTTIVTGLVATQDWTYYTATFTTAATARFITPVLQIIGNDGAGTLIMDAWFDDIQLYPTTPTTRIAA